MQVNETLADGLKRELTVTVPATELDSRLDTKLQELKNRVQLKGFRPGKVPVNHLRKVYGKSAMAEIVDTLVNETTNKTITERGEKAAMQPQVAMTEDESEANEILSGNADLVFTMSYEVLPEYELADFGGIKVERLVADVEDSDIDARLEQLAESNRSYEEVKRAAKDGDRITMDYVGKIDGEAFEGGTDQDAKIVIGAGQFIPGFEEGLLKAKAGDEKSIEVSFPDEYPAENLAGKPATFDVVVKAVEAPGETVFDDEFATRLGIETMEKLKETIKGQIENEYVFAARQKVKRQVLDALDEKHDFPLPENLVQQEFDNIWRQVMHDVEQHGRSFEDDGTTEEEVRKDYTGIAQRRVRLGLVLSRIGDKAEVTVTDEELQTALYQQVSQYRGQEQQALEYYKNNPEALQTLRAPIFEEKVIDYILELSDVTDKTVSKEELLAEDPDDDSAHRHHDHDHNH